MEVSLHHDAEREIGAQLVLCHPQLSAWGMWCREFLFVVLTFPFHVLVARCSYHSLYDKQRLLCQYDSREDEIVS